jgi:hypothetical protein
MLPINPGFHTGNNLSENIQQFGHAPSELLANIILGRKSFKNIGLKDRRIINLPGVSTCLWPALFVRRRLFVYQRFGTAKEELLDP